MQSLGNMQVSSILKPSEPSKKQKVSHRLLWDSIMGNNSFFIVIEAVESGMSVLRAATSYDVPRSTYKTV